MRFVRLRWRLAQASDLLTLATQALHARGLSWGRAVRAVAVLVGWTALTLALVAALTARAVEVWHGA